MLKTLSTDAQQIDLATMTLVIDKDARIAQVWTDPEGMPAEIEAEWHGKAFPVLAELGELKGEDMYYLVPGDAEGDLDVEVQQFTY